MILAFGPSVSTTAFLLFAGIKTLVAGCPPTSPPTGEVYDVVVIGAGMAGLTAAKTLKDADLTFVVLEMLPDIGGRIRTETVPEFINDFFDGEIEIGANWIHAGIGMSGKHPIKKLADKYGIPYYKQDLLDLDTYDTTTEDMPPLDPLKKNVLKKKVGDSAKAKACVDDAAEELYVNSYATPTFQDDRDVATVRSEECDYTPSDAVERELDWQRYDLLSLLEPSRMSLFNLPEDTYSDFKKPENFVTGGYYNIADKFVTEHGLGPFIFNEVTVNGIDYSNEPVTISTDECPDIEALKLIYTPSVGVLEQMDTDGVFNPDLDPPTSENPMKMGTWVKVYVQFDERFWEPDRQWITIGVEEDDRGFGTLWLNMDFELTPKKVLYPGSKILVCFMDQDTVENVLGADKVIDDTEDSLDMQRILQPLEDTFGTLPGYTAFATDWLNDPSAYGSWETWEFFENDPFTLDDYNNFFAPRNERFFLAGSASCNRFFGFVHGAFYSGIRAGNWAVACLDDDATCNTIPCSPCDDENNLQNKDFLGGCANNSP